jgi:hypothetical protein
MRIRTGKLRVYDQFKDSYRNKIKVMDSSAYGRLWVRTEHRMSDTELRERRLLCLGGKPEADFRLGDSAMHLSKREAFRLAKSLIKFVLGL